MRHVIVNRRAVLVALAAGALAGCGVDPARPPGPPVTRPSPVEAGPSRVARPVVARAALAVSRAQVVAEYGRLTPRYWGFGAPGGLRRLPTNRRVIALTFDACGGPGGSGYDAALISYLRRHEVPATLFLNSRWIDANWATFGRLRGEPLFELANHGTRHRPLSVTGRGAYGIGGTRNAGQVYDEVATNQVKLTRLLGTPPRFFRAGTAYSDDVAARIVTAMGDWLVTVSVNGDGGATFTPEQVRVTVTAATSGSLVLCHMNQPRSGTARGIAAAIPQLT